jgi:diguanylate cyclase (GGDEF)-like protein/PAS domain S-box-containing protein
MPIKARSAQSRFCNIPLSLMMVVPFVVQIVGAVGLVGYLSYRSGQQSVNQLATELQNQTANRVELFLKSYLANPALINRINADALRLGQISLQDLPKLEKHLLTQLQQFKTVSHILVGTEQGVLIAANRTPLPSLFVSAPLNPSLVYGYSVDRNGNKIALGQNLEGFDLKKRPWYQAATQAGKPLHVSIFRLADNSDFSFNTSYPIYAPDTGKLLGVFSTASDLSFFHRFMAELQVGKTGRVFVMERNGLLIGNSIPSIPIVKSQIDGKTELKRLKATESNDHLIQNASRYLSNQFHGFEQINTTAQLEFWEDGDRNFVQVVPYKDELGLDWLIVVVVHESDFIGDLQSNTYWTILLCGLTLIVAIVFGILTFHWISKPILHISRASDALTEGRLQIPVSEDNPIAEIRILAKSFNKMMMQVSQSFDRVEVALKESQEKYKILFQTLPIGLSITDQESRIIESNIISENWFGTPNLSQLGCLEQGELNPNVIRPDGSPMPIEEYACFKALQTHASVYDIETGIICADGVLRWFSVSATPIPLEEYGVVLVHINISDRKFAEQAMHRSELKLQAFLDNAPTLITIKDLEGKYLSVNREFAYFMQIPEAEILGKYDYDFFPDLTVKNIRRHELQAIFEGMAIDFEQSLQFPNGLQTFLVTQFPIMNNHDQPCAVASIAIDISDRKRYEIALQESEDRFQKIAAISPEAIYILVRYQDGNTLFEYASPASEELLGVSIEYLMHNPNLRQELFHPDDLAGYEQVMAASLKTMQTFHHEWRIVTSQGQIKWIKSQACPKQRDNGDIAWYGFAIDVSDLKQSEIALTQAEANLRNVNQELERLINLDGLTQIANRRCFDHRIVSEWQRLHREQQSLSLLMFDVDYFKRYNDRYGHQLGDQCLLRIAQAVDQLVCRPADLVARYGGEEFIVILPNTNLEGAISVAENLHNAIADLQIPHQDSDVSDVVTISMGIASDIPNLEQSPYGLINQADQALYDAKQQGRNRSVVFTD